MNLLVSIEVTRHTSTVTISGTKRFPFFVRLFLLRRRQLLLRYTTYRDLEPFWGRGNRTFISVSVYQTGDLGSRTARSTCHRKVEFYQCVIDLVPPVLTTGSTKAVHVLLCLCNNACKRSLAIGRKSRASCPVSRLLSVPL